MSYYREISEKQHQRWAWMWLAYSGFLFIEPIFAHSWRIWAGTLIVFVLFLIVFTLYVQDAFVTGPVRYWLIGATMLLGLVAFPWNGGASCLFPYVSSFLAFSVPKVRHVLYWFALEIALILLEGFAFRHAAQPFHLSWFNVLLAIFLLIVIGGGNIFTAEQKRASCRLQEAQEENVALAAVAERERIARDLHDVLGHTLSVIVLKAELAGRLVIADPVRAANEISDVERTARTALAEVREAIGGYRARGLGAEIEAARRTLDAAGVALISDTEQSGSAGLSPKEETALALALREAVTNIVRHACAKTCRLRFISKGERRLLIVEDDGAHMVAREGNGLRGMRERIESLGGHLSLERDGGTRLLIELPLRAEGLPS